MDRAYCTIDWHDSNRVGVKKSQMRMVNVTLAPLHIRWVRHIPCFVLIGKSETR